MSNVIKLPHAVGNIHIEHGFGNVHGIAVTEEGSLAGGQPAHLAEVDANGSYVPLVDEYQRGVAAGRSEAEARLRSEYEQSASIEKQRIERLLVSIEREFSQLHARWEHRVLQFALGVAKTILKREVSIDSEVVLRQVRESLRHLVGVEKVKLRVHPSDEEILRQHRAAIFSTSDSLREMVIEADQKIEPGGCIVESDSGNVDARLSTQISRLEAMVFSQSEQENRS